MDQPHNITMKFKSLRTIDETIDQDVKYAKDDVRVGARVVSLSHL